MSPTLSLLGDLRACRSVEADAREAGLHGERLRACEAATQEAVDAIFDGMEAAHVRFASRRAIGDWQRFMMGSTDEADRTEARAEIRAIDWEAWNNAARPAFPTNITIVNNLSPLAEWLEGDGAAFVEAVVRGRNLHRRVMAGR